MEKLTLRCGDLSLVPLGSGAGRHLIRRAGLGSGTVTLRPLWIIVLVVTACVPSRGINALIGAAGASGCVGSARAERIIFDIYPGAESISARL